MTNTTLDLSTDWLADASMSTEQRQIWHDIRTELMQARALIQDLELQIKTLQRKIDDEADSHAILTRPEFNREVARMLAFDERYGGMSSILYIDVENLSAITKTYGNDIGREAMRIACDALAKQIRTSDILGRLATNEFGVLLVRCDNANAWKKGEILTAKLQETLSEIGGHKLAPVIHYGAYTFHENEDVAGGLKNAASAMTETH